MCWVYEDADNYLFCKFLGPAHKRKVAIMQRTHGGNECCTVVRLQIAWIFYQLHAVSVALVGGLVKLGQIKIYYKLIIAYLDITD